MIAFELIKQTFLQIYKNFIIGEEDYLDDENKLKNFKWQSNENEEKVQIK